MRLIDADALLKNIRRAVYPSDMTTTIAVGICQSHVKDMPTVDAELVRHGHIEIKAINPYDGEDCYCSECGHWSLLPDYKWCPYCGAKMDGDGNATD